MSNTTARYASLIESSLVPRQITTYMILDEYWDLFQCLIRPICYFLFAIAAAVLMLGVDTPWRRYLAPSFLVPAWQCLSTIHQIQWPSGFGSFLGVAVTVGCVEAIAVLYIDETSVQPKQYVKSASASVRPEYSFVDIWKTAFDLRRLRVPEDNAMRTSTGQTHRRRGHAATHRPFTWWRVARLLALFLLHYIIVFEIFLNQLGPFTLTDLEPVKHTYFRRLLSPRYCIPSERITLRETCIRVFLLASSYIKPYLLIEGSHICAAIIFIYILRSDDPIEWPDLFGSPLEAYTLARFWSRFWHSLHVASYTTWANWLTNLLPWIKHAKPRTRIALQNLIIFSMTGLIHALVGYKLDDPCACRTEIQFYLVSWAALVAERRWLECWRAIKKARREAEGEDPMATKQRMWVIEDALARVVGYVWVILFYLWISPKMYFERMWCMLEP